MLGTVVLLLIALLNVIGRILLKGDNISLLQAVDGAS